MFRPLEGRHQEGENKGIQMQKSMSKICMCRFII